MNSPESHPALRKEFARFAQEFIAPRAGESDRTSTLDPAVIDALRKRQFLGGFLPRTCGGLGMDQMTYGLLTGEIARACSATRTLLTVHGLVATAVLRWGSNETQSEWLPELASGRQLAAFALSELGAGTDAGAIETTMRRDAGDWILSGEKAWVSFGQTADVFLLFGRCVDGVAAVLLPGDCRNLVRHPVTTMVGTRAGMMAHLRLDECRVPARMIIDRKSVV